MEYKEVFKESIERFSFWWRFKANTTLVEQRLESYGFAETERGHGVGTGMLILSRYLLVINSNVIKATISFSAVRIFVKKFFLLASVVSL